MDSNLNVLDLLCFLRLARGAFSTSMQRSDVDAATWCSLTSGNIVTQEEDTKALSRRSLTQPRSPSLLLHVKATPIYPMSRRLSCLIVCIFVKALTETVWWPFSLEVLENHGIGVLVRSAKECWWPDWDMPRVIHFACEYSEIKTIPPPFSFFFIKKKKNPNPMPEFKLKFVTKASMPKLLFVTVTPLSSGSNGTSSSHKSGWGVWSWFKTH